ncbi:MAG TPA: pyridoxamine 5'-phosphate oxidase family protein [Terriglobales bacterium]|nr:pyridoxamine 5'-phosphate oxidase family protein [Terriglobales bacterium]
MAEPRRSRPYWPDALEQVKDSTAGLKNWNWALERLETSHNYWIATSRPDGPPHLMIVWGVWWLDAFWFSTGLRTRKARNIAANPRVVIGTEKADQAVILEGIAEQISERAMWKQLIPIYNRKYGGDIGPMLEGSASTSTVFRVRPQVVFAQDEHADNFTEGVTRWTFQ